MKYGSVTMGQTEAVINKLGGLDAWNRLLAGQVVVRPAPKFPVWKTIVLGNYRTSRGLIDALKKSSCFAHERTEHMVELAHRITLEREVDLVRITLRQLGVTLTCHHPSKPDDLGIFNHELCAEALKQGLEMCPQEVGPQLRLQYLDQPLGECVEPVSEPIGGQIFSLSNYENNELHPHQRLLLSSGNGEARAYYRALNYPYYVFVRPR